MNYTCSICGKTVAMSEGIQECSCGGYLKAPLKPIRRSDIITGDPTLWRYRKALPIEENAEVVTLGEGMTPLVQTKLGGLLCKADSLLPTGSFKDRGAALVINYLKQQGIKKIIEDSSGNAAASYAAYCAAAGIDCHIFTPASASMGKLVQAHLYGAKITKVEGTREAVTLAAREEAEKQAGIALHAGHNQHPLFPEGCKTMAYEIWEQLGWCAPDNIVVPFGAGSSMLGLYKGFCELLSVGEISRMPRFLVVQAHNCNPMYAAFMGKAEEARCVPTIAEGISIAKPKKQAEALAAIKHTGGLVVEIQEDEIMEGVKAAARVGIYVEPTTGTTVAGAMQLQRSGEIQPKERTVVILTGHGLKATDKISKALDLFGEQRIISET